MSTSTAVPTLAGCDMVRRPGQLPILGGRCNEHTESCFSHNQGDFASCSAAPVYEGDEDKTQRARILNAILWIEFATMVVGVLFLPFATNVLTGLLLILGFLALAITGLVLLHRGFIEFASLLLVNRPVWRRDGAGSGFRRHFQSVDLRLYRRHERGRLTPEPARLLFPRWTESGEYPRDRPAAN